MRAGLAGSDDSVTLPPLRLLHLGPLVLEPDLDLVPRQPQLHGEALPPRLREVAAVAELLLEPL